VAASAGAASSGASTVMHEEQTSIHCQRLFTAVLEDGRSHGILEGDALWCALGSAWTDRIAVPMRSSGRCLGKQEAAAVDAGAPPDRGGDAGAGRVGGARGADARGQCQPSALLALAVPAWATGGSMAATAALVPVTVTDSAAGLRCSAQPATRVAVGADALVHAAHGLAEPGAIHIQLRRARLRIAGPVDLAALRAVLEALADDRAAGGGAHLAGGGGHRSAPRFHGLSALVQTTLDEDHSQPRLRLSRAARRLIKLLWWDAMGCACLRSVWSAGASSGRRPTGAGWR